ncbi:MAG: PAS domain S-box protein [Nitrospinae bacterium]|nr:PAS domain S-box protein [Nitrospinota bacterium]
MPSESPFSKNPEYSQILEIFFKHTVSCLALLDKNYNFIRVNEVYAKACNRDVSEFTGKNHFEMYPSDAREIFDRVVETKVPFQTFSRPFVFPDHPEWGVTYWDWTLVPVLDGRGEVEMLVFSLNDVTERHKAEQKIRQQAQIIDQIHDSVISTDMDGHITGWNKGAERLFGYSAQEAMGKHISLLYSEDHFQFLEEHVIAPLKAKGRHEAEVLCKHKSGKLFYIHLSLSLLRDENETAYGMIGYSMDISDRKIAERMFKRYAAELERSNRELDEFASIAAHDLKEPMRKVLTFGGLLWEKYSSLLVPEARDYLERMRKAAERMQLYLNDLLKFSRTAAQPRVMEPVDLAELAAETLCDLEARIAASGAQIHIGPLPKIVADRFLIQQLFQNLLANALKFHKQGEPPVVHLDSRPIDGASWEIVFRDNGIGFDSKLVGELFLPFKRLHGRSKYDGSGMGLAICKKIVDYHKGTIAAQSSPGNGAVFIVTLPDSPSAKH